MILSYCSRNHSLPRLRLQYSPIKCAILLILLLPLSLLPTLTLFAQDTPNYVCPPGQFLHAWETNIAGVCAAAPSGGAPYPGTAGIANFTGTVWGQGYSVSGTGQTVALTTSPTITGADLPNASLLGAALTSPTMSGATLQGTTSFTTLTGNASSTVTAANFLGQFGGQYGTFVLGSGYGGQVEKTVNDSTPVIVASINGATTATGDYYAVKDATGTTHTLLDIALGLHATTINGVALTTSTNKVLLGLPTDPATLALDGNGNVAISLAAPLPTNLPYAFSVGPNGEMHTDIAGNFFASTVNGIGLHTGGPITNYLGEDGNYHAFPATSTGFPITLGATSIAANSTTTNLAGLTNITLSGQTATPDENFNSGTLTLTGSFDDAGPTPQSWAVVNAIGSGLTPTSTFLISPVPGGTTGSRIFEVNADEEILQNGAGRVDITGSTAFLGVGGSGVSVSSGNVTLNGNSTSGNVQLYPGTTGLVIANRPVQAPQVSFLNGGSQINLIGPAGGSGTFTQNVTAENGDLQPCPTGTPTVTPGSAAGGGATATVLGTNCAGMVTLVTGGSPISQAAVFTLTFSNPFTHYGFCTFSPMPVTLGDAGITTNNVGIQSGYNDHFQLILVGGGAAMAPLSNHQWSYTCGGY